MSKYVLAVFSLSLVCAACAPMTNGPLMVSAADSGDGVSEPVSRDVVAADELLVDYDGTAAEERVTCREMLQPASNQIVRHCMTAKAWRTFERAQEEWARRMVRQMQGSRY